MLLCMSAIVGCTRLNVRRSNRLYLLALNCSVVQPDSICNLMNVDTTVHLCHEQEAAQDALAQVRGQE